MRLNCPAGAMTNAKSDGRGRPSYRQIPDFIETPSSRGYDRGDSFRHSDRGGCDVLRLFTGPDSNRNVDSLSRREWLRIGGAAGLELALRKRVTSAAPGVTESMIPGFGHAKSVILIYASG